MNIVFNLFISFLAGRLKETRSLPTLLSDKVPSNHNNSLTLEILVVKLFIGMVLNQIKLLIS